MNDDENFGGIFFSDLEAFKPKRIFVNRHQKYDPPPPHVNLISCTTYGLLKSVAQHITNSERKNKLCHMY